MKTRSTQSNSYKNNNNSVEQMSHLFNCLCIKDIIFKITYSNLNAKSLFNYIHQKSTK